LKSCFKSVYGTSVYAFVRSYRIHAAAALLRENGESVITAAGKVGYINPSKFAHAFKEIMGISPAEYRKKKTSEWSVPGPNGADDAGSFWYNEFKKAPEGIFLNF
jgi:AraC-like DNA-binding protein